MYTAAEVERLAASVPFWWHSIDLGSLTTPGYRTPESLQHQLQLLQLPDVRGRTVLDIGAYDGYFAFEAERRGAGRVVALDHFVWSLDLQPFISDWEQARARGESPVPAHESIHWRPSELPGKKAYDTAHQVLNSNVETVVGDFMDMDVESLGTFDVVFYLGVLYHMQNPFEALRRVASVTRGLAIIETEAMVVPLERSTALCEFFELNELNDDVSNWWSPNERALEGMCRAAGFRRVETVVGPPSLVSWAAEALYSLARQARRGTTREVESVVDSARSGGGSKRALAGAREAGQRVRSFAEEYLRRPVRRYRAVVHASK